jgi:hypothetical protein
VSEGGLRPPDVGNRPPFGGGLSGRTGFDSARRYCGMLANSQPHSWRKAGGHRGWRWPPACVAFTCMQSGSHRGRVPPPRSATRPLCCAPAAGWACACEPRTLRLIPSLAEGRRQCGRNSRSSSARRPGPSCVGAGPRMRHPATIGLAQTPSSFGYLASASRRSSEGSTGALRQIIQHLSAGDLARCRSGCREGHCLTVAAASGPARRSREPAPGAGGRHGRNVARRSDKIARSWWALDLSALLR